MTLSDLSIRRPVFATVVSLLIIVFGAASMLRLPIRELPDVDTAVITVTTGVRNVVMRAIERAIASAWPRSSEAASGEAPGVSTKVTTGRPKRSAMRKRRIAFR